VNIWRHSFHALNAMTSIVAADPKRATTAARVLASERTFGGRHLAELVRAGVQTGDEAARTYASVAKSVNDADWPVIAIAARLRLAELRGDEAGRQAEIAALVARGIVAPDAFVNLFAPRAAASR
jgi:hypothetical protein